MARYFVELKDVGNPDRGENPNRSVTGLQAETVEVDGFEEASRVCLDYIDQHDLGGGNWSGGKIVDEDGVFVGQVSYNGKVWGKPSKNWTPDDEPIYAPGSGASTPKP